MLKLDSVQVGYKEKIIIDNISFSIKKGELIGIIGSNGSGKSTLLKTIYQQLKPLKGTILLENTNMDAIKIKDIFKKMAVVGQENDIPFDFTVKDIVSMGRNPHKGYFQRDDEYDHTIIDNSLKHIGMQNRKNESYSTLSGGEKQRVVLARALSQDSPFLLLDEPTNHLDIFYQMQIFDLLKELQLTTLAAIHDLNIASLYCDKLLVLKEKEMVAFGTPMEVLSEKLIYEVFNIKCFCTIHPMTKKKNITFLPKNI